MDNNIKKIIQGLFLICLILMLWFYGKGYDNSIGWEVTSAADVIQYPGIEVEGQLKNYTIIAEKYLLTESYTGGPIVRNRTMDTILVTIGWLGLCVVLVGSSFLKRFGFLAALGLFTLLINRLNLADIGLFGIETRIALFIPFVAMVGPLFYFHEYRPKTGFLLRLASLILISLLIAVFGISEPVVFLDHYVSHSLFSLSIAGLLFLFIIAEENLFGILNVVTRSKGGQSNHLHFIVLSMIYLGNLILYYLNKSGIIPNSFSFFDPFLLLTLSCIVAFFTIKHKAGFVSKYVSEQSFYSIFYGLGIILLSLLSIHFYRGNDAVYESFHYFILYFHIGFGFFFILYIIINFIDPLIEGLEVFKIAYKEQHFPYVSARLGGFAVIFGFYFLATQEPYDLLKSGYYVSLANLEETNGKPDLADQYYKQAAFLGYNTHHSNYQLAWNYSDKGNAYLTKVHFENASERFPSPYAYVNYANLDKELNLSKVQATLEVAASKFSNGEIKNNQGVLRIQSEEWGKALEYFEAAQASDTWNQAPLLNKWATLYQLHLIDSSSFTQDYQEGNYGVKSNVLFSLNADSKIPFELGDLSKTPSIHRQAYLLSALPVFDADTLARLATQELEISTNGNYNDRLRKALIIHYYKKGDVNATFRMLDYLQANSYQSKKGAYLNELGILALDQGAYLLALDFFDRAIENQYSAAAINRLEALAWLGREKDIPNELFEMVQADPGLTNLANTILERLENGRFDVRNKEVASINYVELNEDQLMELASVNAFAESQVIESIKELTKRGYTEAYNLILEAAEINQFSPEILKQFVSTSLELNLARYAEDVLPRIKALVSTSDYATFNEDYQKRKAELDNQEW